MKRIAIFCVSALIALAVGSWLYYDRLFQTYPEHAIAEDTGIKNFSVLTKVHNEYEWYARVRIQPSDADALLKRYQFRSGFSRAVLHGKLMDDSVPDCPECEYYLDEEQGSVHDYKLYVLSDDKTELLAYEVFGS